VDHLRKRVNLQYLHGLGRFTVIPSYLFQRFSQCIFSMRCFGFNKEHRNTVYEENHIVTVPTPSIVKREFVSHLENIVLTFRIDERNVPLSLFTGHKDCLFATKMFPNVQVTFQGCWYFFQSPYEFVSQIVGKKVVKKQKLLP